MILTLKLSAVAFNYSDGSLPSEKKSKTMAKNELKELPAILPYLGKTRLAILDLNDLAHGLGFMRRLHLLLSYVPGGPSL